MIAGLVEILLFQGAGEVVSHFLVPPIPGPVVGLILLLAWFHVRKRIDAPVDLVGTALVQNLGLLFIPAAGCYALDVSWARGAWRAIFAAGR